MASGGGERRLNSQISMPMAVSDKLTVDCSGSNASNKAPNASIGVCRSKTAMSSFMGSATMSLVPEVRSLLRNFSTHLFNRFYAPV